MNKTPRIVCAAIFFFDCSRLLFLLSLLSAWIRPGLMFSGSDLPFLMLAAPNALFPLISLFMLVRPRGWGDCRAFIPLYITGKLLALLGTFIWLYSSIMLILLSGSSAIVWTLFLSLADIGTILGMALKAKGDE